MQLTKVFAILSLAATSLAAPTVEMMEKRTEEPQKGISCGYQNVGELKCCEQKPELKPTTQTGLAPALSGLLGIFAGIVPNVVPTVAVTAQCVAVVAQVQACNNVKVCCINPNKANGLSPQTQSGLISLLSGNNILSNNQIAVCPSVAV
ncbi:hypothetical protein VTL71DRAFT_11581 [Oculimacula yallundae]|uniref:Hydrophobin n=1 Tax=Oculimacula yallundae TaxID=86028 RepID=A0ABR4CR58_9HELO